MNSPKFGTDKFKFVYKVFIYVGLLRIDWNNGNKLCQHSLQIKWSNILIAFMQNRLRPFRQIVIIHTVVYRKRIVSIIR